MVGLLLALEHRDRTGEGGLVEAAMVDAALNIAAEQVIEHSAYGALLERAGNRGPVAAPQNLYQAAGPDDDGRDDCWVAIAVATDEQWAALAPRAWATRRGRRDPTLATADGRAQGARPDRRAPAGVVPRPVGRRHRRRCLWDAGVPVGKVVQPHRQPDLAQLDAPRLLRGGRPPGDRHVTVQHPARCGFPRARSGSTPATPRSSASTTPSSSASSASRRAEIEALEAAGIIGDTLAQQA